MVNILLNRFNLTGFCERHFDGLDLFDEVSQPRKLITPSTYRFPVASASI
ncbi:MAG: hypothetical protein SFY66_11440 [Oculatellaceae cyanobacterium bins.114]|nr:hypothetical protein [Oculatellaceae cyanobacterium bins.114]